jgi:hypothetical protein
MCHPVVRFKHQAAHPGEHAEVVSRMTDLDIRRPDPQPYDLGDRYRSGSGAVVLTGVQAIARTFKQRIRQD